MLGVLTLVPYTYWKKTHAMHHATSGDLSRRGFGDVDTKTVREYQALRRPVAAEVHHADVARLDHVLGAHDVDYEDVAQRAL